MRITKFKAESYVERKDFLRMANVVEFPVIALEATGRNIQRLRMEKRLTIREVQTYFGFEEPTAIYRWQRGENLPSLDNVVALSKLFHVTVEEILVLKTPCEPSEKENASRDAKRGKKFRSLLFFMAA